MADVSRLYDIRRGLDLPPMERREAVFDLRFGGWWAPLDLQPPSPFLPGFALAVVRVKYESPGFVDVAGVGKAIEQFRLFAQYLIDLVVNRSLRKLEADDVEQDVIAKRLRTPNASWTLKSGRGN